MKRTVLCSLVCFVVCIGLLPTTKSFGQSTFVPSVVYVTKLIDTVGVEKYRVHEVAQGHTLFSICKAYSCEAKNLIKDSPGQEVRIGEYIYIPYKKLGDAPAPKQELYYTGKRPIAIANTSEEGLKASVVNIEVSDNSKKSDNLDDSDFLYIDTRSKDDTIRIALMLPLHLKDTLSSNARSFSYLPFLEGSLTAWDEYLENSETKSHPLKLKVFDVTDVKSSINAALSDPYTKESDVIVGAVYTKVFDTLQKFAKAHKIPFIHPLTEHDSMAKGNPFYVQCMPSYAAQAEALSNYITSNYPLKSYQYIIYNDSLLVNRIRSTQLYKTILKRTGESDKVMHYSMTPSRIAKLSRLSDSVHYVFIGYADKEIVILNTLIALKKSPIKETVFMGPAKWKSFTKIESDYFKRMKYICFLPFNVDKDEEHIALFEKAYYEFYGVLPAEMAYKGYTCFNWLMSTIEESGRNFLPNITKSNVGKFPFSLFRFTNRAYKGYENVNLPLLELMNYDFKKIQ